MSKKEEAILKDIVDGIQAASKQQTTPYDTTAEVTRVDGNTAYVHIPGGVDETPVTLTQNAKPGDNVQVRVSGGRAWIVGNATAPPTDDTKANAAYNQATTAADAAASAVQSANTAQEAAGRASSAASRAEGKADTASAAASRAESAASAASTAAGNASTAAASAASSANNALTQLSTVEKVVDTLTWISEHATYKASTDTAVVPGKYYFSRSGSSPNYTYSIITNPTGNPSTSGYYEIDTIDEAVSNYIETHLALDSEGLWLIPDSSSGNRVLIATGGGSTYTTAGTYIIDGNGNTVGAFLQNSAQVGSIGASDTNVLISSGSMAVRTGTTNRVSIASSSIPGFTSRYSNTITFCPGDGATDPSRWPTITGGTPPASSTGNGLYMIAQADDGGENVVSMEAMRIGGGPFIGSRVRCDETGVRYQVNPYTYDGAQYATSHNFTGGPIKVGTSNDPQGVIATGDIEDGSGNVLAEMLKGSAGSSGTAGITLGPWKLCWGSYTTNTSSASGSGTFAAPYYVNENISFSFSATPHVWAQVQGGLTGSNYALVTTTSTTGATIRLMSSGKTTNTRTIRWFAIGLA